MKPGVRLWTAGMWQRYNRIKKDKTSGFTLVELIVVLVVLGILCTLAVMGIMGWQDYADFKKNNEFAQNIFSAAQIQLTQYGERGQLTELINAVTNDGNAERTEYLLSAQGNLTDSDESGYDENGIWQDGNKGNIYFLKVNKGDYETYINTLKGQSVSDKNLRRMKALFDLIDPYIADKAMLDASICIEFDPDPKVAQVYSVFYNEKAGEFTYEASSVPSTSGVVSIRDRQESERKKDKTGYYGVETMAKGTDTFISRPVITELRLNNKETLNLTWSTKGDGADLVELIYTINFFETAEKTGEKGNLLMSLVLGAVDEENLDNTLFANGNRILCNVSTKGKDQDYWFPLIHDKSADTLTLVLDGLDLAADEGTTDEAFADTVSIRRFGIDLDVDSIYATISGSRPGVYDLTVEKRSNSEHPLFGGMRIQQEDNAVLFGIENVRHLNNIRYQEQAYVENDGTTGAPVFRYQVGQDISWEYALNQETVYEKGTVLKPDGAVSGYYFNPLSLLRRNSVLETDDANKTRTLKRFRMDIDHRRFTDEENFGIGLVVQNRGMIQNLILEDVYVNGVTNQGSHSAVFTGGFCGVSEGALSNLKVLDSGTVESSRAAGYNQIKGVNHVGGIAGSVVAANGISRTYANLTNRISVTGQQYVGGIAGGLQAAGTADIAITECENYGKIRGQILTEGKGAYYFGGIAGRTERMEAASGEITIRDCVSSPYYTEDEVNLLIEHMANPEQEVLIENFVGGIVGFNDAAVIDNCSTVRESADRPGYVVGRDFVGGIVGYNAGTAGDLRAGERNNRNQAHIIGHSYVGGISGCNAIGFLDESQEPYKVSLTDESLTQDRATITGWINEGMITAVGNYAGGIVGYNGETGAVHDSYSNVDYNESVKRIAGVSSESRFAGGVAGYNKGVIRSTTSDPVSVVSVVTGKDYIGGVVGCNDVGGVIENYALKGGYVEGNHFVGGYVGLNMDQSIFESNITSNPNQVTGNYFVGGILGGNLVPATESLTAYFETDNFLGSLIAEQGAFAGGFIGYNYMLEGSVAERMADNNTEDNSKSEDMLLPRISLILYETNKLCSSLKPLPQQEDVTDFNPEQTVTELLSVYANHSDTMNIVGMGEADTSGQELLGGIQAKIYVGGVVGYNNPNTSLTIRNVENITPVQATGYIKAEEGVSGNVHHYSYAGGIIGKVEQNVTVDNCRNRDVGDVRAKGTYTGGLAEINYGTIMNCEAGSIGDGTDSYVGGLIGVNAAKNMSADGTQMLIQGTVTNCVINGQVSGVSYVGGLVAENYGIIEYNGNENSHEAIVDASGSYAGGIVGYAHKGGIIRFNGDLELDIDVTGSASCVGGIAGVNAGSITVMEHAVIENKIDNVMIGRKNVGGFIGMQTEPDGAVTLHGFKNRAHVQASTGLAGGITAIVMDRVTIEKCENFGSVEVLSREDTMEAGDITEEYEEIAEAAAGGITAVNYGRIISCVSAAEVTAGEGYMGGIAAVNFGTIENSEVGTEQDAGNTLELTGGEYVGGIAGINEKNAVIRHSAVKNAILYNQSESSGGNMGGIAAWNQGSIRDCQVGVSFDSLQTAMSESDYSKLRDEAAENAAAGMAGSSLIKEGDTIEFSVALVSNAVDVTMGGVAGRNDGSITGGNSSAKADYSVVSADLRFAGTGTGFFGNMGGIAGINGNEISKYEFSGYVRGEANNSVRAPEFNANNDLEPTKNRVYGYGGIAGVNGSDLEETSARITNCYLGMAKIQGSGSSGNRANVGGVAGVNGIGASVSDIVFSRKQDVLNVQADKPTLFEYSGFVNPTTGEAKGTVWVDVTNYGHIGGVVGYNHGNITRINWSGNYETARNQEDASGKGYFTNGIYNNKDANGASLSDVDDSWVMITTRAGHVGGIVGYNRRTGSVAQVVTGRNWLVRAEQGEQDNGTGGIIGYNISEQNLEQCDNHATVVKMQGNAVGGMVGRNENGTTSSWRFYDCRNYGNIYAKARSGGIIGNWKYRGGTLEKCRNYGIVSAEAEGVGGILGRTYGITSGETLYFIQCENHGEIVAKGTTPIGGIVGQGYQNQGLSIAGCVNTGMIADKSGNDSSGGILGSVANTGGVKVTDCRNYGYSKSQNAIFCGITPASVEIDGCFGVTGSDGMYPIGKSNVNGNYYFVNESTDVVDGDFYVSSIVAEGNATTNRDALWKVISGTWGNSGNFFFNSNNPGTMTFRFNRPVNLDNITLTWPSDGRLSSYEIQFFNEDDPVQLSGQEGVTIAEVGVSGKKTYELDGNAITEVRLTGIAAKKSGKGDNAVLFQFHAKQTGTDNKMIFATESDKKYIDTSSKTRTVYAVTITKDSLGIPLRIVEKTEGNYAVDVNNAIILKDINQYTGGDILNEDRKKDSSLSYKLCKGTTGTDGTLIAGLDSLLIVSLPDDAKLEAPKNLKIEAINGEYKVSWDATEHAQYYEVSCIYEYAGDEKTEAVYIAYSTAVLFPAPAKKDSVAAKRVTVSVTACNGIMQSAASKKESYTFGHVLPTPQIQWKLSGLGDGGQYRAVLENREEYVEFVKNYILPGEDGRTEASMSKIEVELEKIMVKTTGLQTVSFSVKDGAKKNGNAYQLYSSNSTNTINFVNSAVYEGSVTGIEASAKVIRESMCPRKENYLQFGNPTENKTKFANVEIEKTAQSVNVGFSGTTAKELTYNVKMSRGDGSGSAWVPEIRAELIADDPELHVPVAFAVSEQTKISASSEAVSQVSLSNLPEDFLQYEDGISGWEYRYQNVIVRAYPTKMSNDVVFQGWTVSDEEYTGDQLRGLQVSEYGELILEDSKAANLIGNNKLKAGYVLVWGGENEAGETVYKLYYNTLLKVLQEDSNYKPADAGEIPEGWGYKGKTHMAYQVFYHYISLKDEVSNVQPTPVVFAQAEYDSVNHVWKDGDYDGSNKFTLTWDQAAAGDKPAYTQGQAESLYQDAAYRLLVTGIKDGKETVLVNNEEFKTEIRSGTYNTYTAEPSRVSTWDYEKLHVTLTRLGTVDQNGITTKFPSTVEKDLPMRRRLSQVKDVIVTLKKNDEGVVLKDGLDYVVSFVGVPEEEEQGGLDHYQVTVSSRETVSPSATRFFRTEMPNAGVTEVDISLEKFKRNEPISITVQAIAKQSGADDRTGYRDGLVSASKDQTVPNRLIQPQMGKPTESAAENNMTEVGHRDSMSVVEFEEGCITLHMKNETYTDQNLTYQIALGLYGSKDNAEKGENPIDVNLLPTKRKPGAMTSESSKGYHSYVLKQLPTEYAGKWLRVVLRSTGSSNISSVWTDEADEGNPEITVEKCMVFKLPDVQIDTVSWAELDPDTEMVTCSIMNGGNPVGNLEVTAEQQLVAFDLVQHAQKYHIMMVQTLQQAAQKATGSNAELYQVSDINDMLLWKEDDTTYYLSYWTTEGADIGKQPGTGTEPVKLMVGEGAQEIPYKEAISVDRSDNRGNYIETAATVMLLPGDQDGSVRVIFRLPDCKDISDSDGNTLGVQERTEQILVQAITDEENDSYLDSKWAMLSWDAGSFDKESIIEIQNEPVTPDGITTGQAYDAEAVTRYSGVSYEWKDFYSRTRYVASISDSSGKELGIFGVPIYVDTSGIITDTKAQRVWFPDSFARYSDREMNVKFRSIFDVGSDTGGLSQDYTDDYTVTLPALPEAVTSVVVSGLSDVQQYPIYMNTNAVVRSSRRISTKSGLRMITARQKQLVWEYDLEDTKTVGYELELSGSHMDSDYRLNIDLHRELFGVMPGLEEYMTENGKLLYTVSYDVDGEIFLKLNPEAGTASPSNAEMETATPSNLATASNSQTAETGVLSLTCTLKAEYVTDEAENTRIRFTLQLPDLSYDYMETETAVLYEEQFPDELFQTEELRLTPVMVNRYYRKEDTILDLTEMRGEIENDLLE